MCGIKFELKYLAVAAFFFLLGAAFTAYGDNIKENVRYAFSLDGPSVDSPSDHIKVNELSVFSDKAVINKQNLRWARILDTHSMEPTLNKNSVSLEVLPGTSSEINVGDIISFEKNGKIIIHRVISAGEDDNGWFAVTKGDNNNIEDPGKVRFLQVKGLVVGVLY